MPDWIGIATKVLGILGQRAGRRWLFEAELLKASRTVYTYERGDAPIVDIWIHVRVHNRNSAPTTVYADRVEVKLKGETDKGLSRPTVAPHGRFPREEKDRYDMGATSSIELTFWTRRYNPSLLREYLENSSVQVTLELAETFGNRRKLTGPLPLNRVVKQ